MVSRHAKKIKADLRVHARTGHQSSHPYIPLSLHCETTNGDPILGLTLRLIERLAVAFDADGQHYNQEQRDGPKVGGHFNQAVAFQ